MTPSVDTDFIQPTLNLSTDIINRLVALKSLLDLGEMELVSVASSRLDTFHKTGFLKENILASEPRTQLLPKIVAPPYIPAC